MMSETFSIETLGCKVNQYESQAIYERFVDSGYIPADPEDADIIVINSCTVTDQADKKSRKLLKKLKKLNPRAKIVATGCVAVLQDDIDLLDSMEEVHKVVPNKDKIDIVNIIGEDLGHTETSGTYCETVTGFESHTRAFIKIQDGCSQSCSYCKVRLVRGSSTSKGLDDILDEFNGVLDNGYKEIVLTGICLGSWRGKNGEGLASLLKQIVKINKQFRIRLSSIEPRHIDPELIKTVSSSPKICKHLHIPLQSGSDKVLERMNRNYDVLYYEGLVNDLRMQMPSIGITSDVILGFPGETDKDFSSTMKFIEKISPSRLHVFRYSERKNTRAYDLSGKVAVETAKKRVERLIATGKGLEKQFSQIFINKDVEVLLEKKVKNGFFEGYTGEYVKVRIGKEGINTGDLISVKPYCIIPNEACLEA